MLAICIAVVSLIVSESRAQPLPEGHRYLHTVGTRTEGGKLCLGYNPDTAKWEGAGQLHNQGRFHSIAQKVMHFCLYERGLESQVPLREFVFMVAVCPVPDDLLTEEHVYDVEVLSKELCSYWEQSRSYDGPEECTRGRQQQGFVNRTEHERVV